MRSFHLLASGLLMGFCLSHAKIQPLPSRAAVLTVPRGGACDNKVAVGVATVVQGAGLTGLVVAAKKLSEEKFPQKLGKLPVLQWLSLLVVVFASPSVRALVDGGLTASSLQFLQPSSVPGDASWYSSLKKPWFNPPAWVFPIMWLIVSKPTQLWAISRIVNDMPLFDLFVYCIYLSLGDSWNQVFFECQNISTGKSIIFLFWLALTVSTYLFSIGDKQSGLLMLPTLGWVTVATALNIEIDRLN